MQGFNMGRYIPPEALDAGLTSANAASGKGHALGSRARKINQGILTVRFEMPFAVWCESCPKPTIIAQGVRFNAEKKKVGQYHSTPVLSFRMKHNACGGWLEIRTDPKNTEYVVHEGGKRRDYGEDTVDKSTGPLGEILTEEEKERRRNDAFAAFEGKVEEKQKGQVEGQRVQELLQDRSRDWKDPYAANQRIRKSFRAERKVRHRNEEEKSKLQDKLGLNLEILDEIEADQKAAKLVSFGTDDGFDLGGGEVARKVSSRPLFETSQSQQRSATATIGNESRAPSTKAAIAANQSRARLADTLRGNTRSNRDPFDPSSRVSDGPERRLPGIRRRPELVTENEDESPERLSDLRPKDVSSDAAGSHALVDYDSD